MKTATKSQSYGADDARTHLPELLERAHHGKSTVITKRGRPYAVLAPVGTMQGAPRLLLSAFKGSGSGLWGKDSRKAVDAMRDEWA